MRRSHGFWEGVETDQSRGNGPRPDTADLCDSLAWKAKQFAFPGELPRGTFAPI
jgi:hypothetical protein